MTATAHLPAAGTPDGWDSTLKLEARHAQGERAMIELDVGERAVDALVVLAGEASFERLRSAIGDALAAALDAELAEAEDRARRLARARDGAAATRIEQLPRPPVELAAPAAPEPAERAVQSSPASTHQRVLAALADAAGPVTSKELQALLGTPQSKTDAALRLLRRDGLAECQERGARAGGRLWTLAGERPAVEPLASPSPAADDPPAASSPPSTRPNAAEKPPESRRRSASGPRVDVSDEAIVRALRKLGSASAHAVALELGATAGTVAYKGVQARLPKLTGGIVPLVQLDGTVRGRPAYALAGGKPASRTSVVDTVYDAIAKEGPIRFEALVRRAGRPVNEVLAAVRALDDDRKVLIDRSGKEPLLRTTADADASVPRTLGPGQDARLRADILSAVAADPGALTVQRLAQCLGAEVEHVASVCQRLIGVDDGPRKREPLLQVLPNATYAPVDWRAS